MRFTKAIFLIKSCRAYLASVLISDIRVTVRDILGTTRSGTKSVVLVIADVALIHVHCINVAVINILPVASIISRIKIIIVLTLLTGQDIIKESLAPGEILP